MNKKDIFELKSRLKKNGCTFTKMCGCYVNVDKEILIRFNETFLNLEEEEFYKYLDIAKKTLSGNIGNNLLELNFPLDEEKDGGKQQFLLGLRESKLKNEGLLDTFYQLIIESYEYAGNYLILAFHDAYDVMTKTTDNSKLDESEEVYEYLLFAICPMTLTKPGLGYLEDENRIGPRNRDWVVGAPDAGFVFPAFTDRSTDIHSVMFYTKNVIEPHTELMEMVLGCPIKSTATQQKNTFQTIVKNAICDSEKSEKIFSDIQESLSQLIEEEDEFVVSSEEPVILTGETVKEILKETGLTEDITEKIESAYAETFSDTPPVVDHLLDKKVLAENDKRKVEKALAEQVVKLQEKLEETMKAVGTVRLDNDLDNQFVDLNDSGADTDSDTRNMVNDDYDVILKVKPEKMDQIKSQVIDGKKCIIIPMDEDEHLNVNGVMDLV